MEEFSRYLLDRRLATEKTAPFYLHWVRRYRNFFALGGEKDLTDEGLERFLTGLAGQCESWQVRQAEEAVKLYLFFQERRRKRSKRGSVEAESRWKDAAEQMRRVMRLKHLSPRTEKTYLGWVRRLYAFLGGRSPRELAEGDVRDFMTHLAVEAGVSAATQNQAFNAILFLFRHVLGKNIEDISSAVRARKKRRLPVVLTREEVSRLFEQMQGTGRLMARLIYGCGLRLRECLRLRIQDVDFNRNAVVVRGGKGDKDRETVLPESIKAELAYHLKGVRMIFDADRRNSVAGVMLPGALERKYPNDLYACHRKEPVWSSQPVGQPIMSRSKLYGLFISS